MQIVVSTTASSALAHLIQLAHSANYDDNCPCIRKISEVQIAGPPRNEFPDSCSILTLEWCPHPQISSSPSVLVPRKQNTASFMHHVRDSRQIPLTSSPLSLQNTTSNALGSLVQSSLQRLPVSHLKQEASITFRESGARSKLLRGNG